MMKKALLCCISMLFLLLLDALSVHAETITTRNYWILQDGYETQFVRPGFAPNYTFKITKVNANPESFFNVDYFVTGTQQQRYDASGNLLYRGTKKPDGRYWFVANTEKAAILFPAQMEIGQSFQNEWATRVYDSSGSPGNGYDKVTVTVSGPVDVSVPAGNFSAYIFEIEDQWRDSSGGSGTNTWKYWMVEGGCVKIIINDQEEYQLANPLPIPSMTVTPSSVTVAPMGTGSCTISGGVGPYTSVSSNTGIVQTSAAATNMYYMGVSAGTATITVGDTAGNSVAVPVTVTAGPATLTVAPSSVTVAPMGTGSCTISGGVGPYTSVSSNTGIVQTSAAATNMYYMGVSAGTATITVWDTAGNSVAVPVTVTAGPATLTVTPSSVTVAPMGTGSCTITGGIGPYTSVSSNSGIVQTSAAATNMYYMGVSPGSATITVWDSAGHSVAVPVTVTPGPSTITVTPSSVTVEPMETGSCSISGGIGPYTSVSSNEGTVQTSAAASTMYYMGVSPGSATITVWDSAGHSVAVPVTVTPPSTYTNSLGMTFILLPAGTFAMGSPSDEPGRLSREGPQHSVTLTQPFYMQQTEVTQAQWEAVMHSNPSHYAGCPSCPVEVVSWEDAQTFISYMNMRGEGTYALPTEAQWEYAVRAGTSTAFYSGGITKYSDMLECAHDSNLNAIGWYCYNSNDQTLPVAQKTPNAWGLYDMSGNVWEWCQDWYSSSYYSSSPSVDPTGPSSGTYRILRGGSYAFWARECRSAERHYELPISKYINVGFRLVRSAGQ